MKIEIFKHTGDFAENKDVAKDLRVKHIMPAVAAGKDVLLDFSKVNLSTQSFIHALISDVIRKHGMDALDKITFKGCNSTIKTLISTVCDYMQDS